MLITFLVNMINYLERCHLRNEGLLLSHNFEKVWSIMVRKASAVSIGTGVWVCLLKSWLIRKQITQATLRASL